MRILVTGGAGFLGLHIAKYIAKQGKDTAVLYDIAPFNTKEYPKKNCEFIHGDVRDKKKVAEVMKGIDAVIHAAAALPLCSAAEILDVNINGTKNLLNSSLKLNVKRFLYISSTAVYGVPKKHPVYETDPMVGVGPYGTSKIESEKAIEGARKKGLIVTIIRPKTFVGTHRLGVFEILFDWIKDGKRIPVIGNGNNRYQLLDVDDLVEVIYLCITSKKAKAMNDTFNIGADSFQTVRKDLQEVFDFAHSGSRLLPTPAAPIKTALFVFEKLHLSPLYQWVYDTADRDSFVSIDKLKKTLDWKPKYSNGQALVKAYKWYLDNYDDIKSRPAGVSHTVGWKQGILGVFKKFL